MADDDHRWDLWADAFIDCEVDGVTRYMRSPNAEALPGGAPIFTVTAYDPSGRERADACELGRRYGQLGVFELTDTEVHVVGCSDAAIVRTRPR